VVAEEYQRLLDDGLVNSRAEIAKLYGVSRARVTQVMKLLTLPVPVKEYLTSLPAERSRGYPERRLREVVGLPSEQAQVRAFNELRNDMSRRTRRDQGIP
jgi:hypothetical protein